LAAVRRTVWRAAFFADFVLAMKLILKDALRRSTGRRGETVGRLGAL
jgi:hypothetical protein